jgi:8-oxo-dGTP pyrophosphatase MutT (NUDIX family)
VKDWGEEAQTLEKQAKEDCGISLYVITPHLEGVYSIAEMTEDAITRRPERTVVCILSEYHGKSFEKAAQRSLDAVVDLLKKHSCHIVPNLQQCAGLLNHLAENPPDEVYMIKNKWLSLKKLFGPTGEYVFSHEERCGGNIVAILPYQKAADGSRQVMAREEFTPPWSITDLQLSCITGGVDAGEAALVAALRELYEETGITAPAEALVSLGTVRGSKSSDSVYHLFTVDVTPYLAEAKVVEGEDDNEKRAHNVWVHPSLDGLDGRDPILYTMLHRLEHRTEKPKGLLDNFHW